MLRFSQHADPIKLIHIALILVTYSQAYAQKEPQASVRAGATNQFSAVFAYRAYEQRVHNYYNSEQYARALDGYHRLAMYNNKLAQYRLAYMYSQGLGTETDWVEAFAWSVLAKESLPQDQDEFQQTYINLHEYIKNRLPVDSLTAAKMLADDYLSRYGTFIFSIKARRKIHRDKHSRCTGSLVGNCDNVRTVGVNGFCTIRANDYPPPQCLLYGSVGLPGLAGISYQELRTVTKQITQTIDDYNPGRVELGEFDVLEPDSLDQ